MNKDALRRAFGDLLVEALENKCTSRTSPEIDPAQFSAEIGAQYTKDRVVEFLDAAVVSGLLEAIETSVCPISGCGRYLDADDVANSQCPHCRTDYRVSGDSPAVGKVYRISGGRSRDIVWLIAVHGMNTLGSWQEEFSWRVANKLKYSAPVFIYKYGLTRISVLFGWRHRALAHQLGRRIQEAIRQAKDRGISAPPDIVIHSFGSQLFAILLDLPDFQGLRFGRVIATGCVIRPDFDWSKFIDSARIEAVLNHCGGKDCAVPFSQFFIPATGPGGKCGFADNKVLNVFAAEYRHSSYFESDALTANLQNGGLWDRFLRQPTTSISNDPSMTAQAVKWRPVPWIIGFLFRMVAISAIVLVLVIFMILLTVGSITVVRWL